MNSYYHILPTVEHYRCTIDILCHSRFLDEAQDFIEKIPIDHNAALWSCFLGAYVIHKKLKVGECVPESLLGLDPKRNAPYVLFPICRSWGVV